MLLPAVSENPIGDAALELGSAAEACWGGVRRCARSRLHAVARGGRRARRPSTSAPGVRQRRRSGASSRRNDFFRDAIAQVAPTERRSPTWRGASCSSRSTTRPNAARSFQAALRTSAEDPSALLGLAPARWRRTIRRLARKLAAAGTVGINAKNAGAHVLLAELALDELKRDDAKAAVVQKALAVNPNHFEALSLKAAIAWLEKRTADYDATTAALLKLNPTYGEVYPRGRRRGGAAVPLRRCRGADARAITVDRENVRAYADLGAHLMRTGDERGARRALETAFRADPYDVVTYNLLGCSTRSTASPPSATGDMVIRLHQDEAAVMREYVPALAREALARSPRAGTSRPPGPILIEMFPRHDDFAVRTLGLPGMLGALGACFGKVVTLDSPKARPPGRLQLGRHAVARARARHHAAALEPAGAAVAHRGHLGLGRDAGASRRGAARWRSPSPARSTPAR